MANTPHPGQLLTGPLFSEPMRVETVQPIGPANWVVGLVGVQSDEFLLKPISHWLTAN